MNSLCQVALHLPSSSCPHLARSSFPGVLYNKTKMRSLRGLREVEGGWRGGVSKGVADDSLCPPAETKVGSATSQSKIGTSVNLSNSWKRRRSALPMAWRDCRDSGGFPGIFKRFQGLWRFSWGGGGEVGRDAGVHRAHTPPVQHDNFASNRGRWYRPVE